MGQDVKVQGSRETISVASICRPKSNKQMASKKPPSYVSALSLLPDGLAAALDGDRPSPQQVAEARRIINHVRVTIRRARELEERRTGRLIEPELPYTTD